MHTFALDSMQQCLRAMVEILEVMERVREVLGLVALHKSGCAILSE